MDGDAGNQNSKEVANGADGNQNKKVGFETPEKEYEEYHPLQKLPHKVPGTPASPEAEPLTAEGKQNASPKKKRTKGNIIKNIAVLSVAFVLLMASCQALIVLQSSLNPTVGVFGLCANFIFVVISCLFLSTYLVQKIGCKWSIVLGMSCTVTWMAANFHGGWESILPTSVIMGLGIAPIWTGQCTYTTILGIEYAELTNQMPDAVLSKFFGIFFMGVMTGPIWGNLISGGILLHDKRLKAAAAAALNLTTGLNGTGEHSNRTKVVMSCGKGFCPRDYIGNADAHDPSEFPDVKWIYVLIGIYIAMTLLGILSLVIFLDDERPSNSGNTKFSFKLLAATGKQLKNKYQLLLIPLTIYIGMEQGFMVAEFTMAFITCTMGLAFVGLVVIIFAAVGAAMSVFAGQVVQKTGRLPLYAFAGVAHLSFLIGIGLCWEPSPDQKWVFFVGAVVWALGDGVIQSQTNALYGALFHDASEAAFSNYRMWESVGFILTFSYSSFACVEIKLYVLIGILIIGWTCYFIAEVMRGRELAKLEEIQDKEKQLTLAESAEVERDDKNEPMRMVANLARRKSSIFIPDAAIQRAESIIRRSSSGVAPPEGKLEQQKQIRRRISALAPAQPIRPLPQLSEHA